jgi:hypothetical protein
LPGLQRNAGLTATRHLEKSSAMDAESRTLPLDLRAVDWRNDQKAEGLVAHVRPGPPS